MSNEFGLKRLFSTEYWSYTAEGRQIARLTAHALKEVMETVVEQEWDWIDAENIMTNEISILFCELRLEHGSKQAKKERDLLNTNKENSL